MGIRETPIPTPSCKGSEYLSKRNLGSRNGLRLTHYLRQAKEGEEIVVTQRGKPVALIQPISAGATAVGLEAKLAKLAADGLVRLPTSTPLKKVRKVDATGTPISRTIIEDRR